MLVTGNNQNGFSLTELVIYIGVITIVFLLGGSFIVGLTKNNHYSQQQQQLRTQNTSVTQYISHVVHHAAEISKPTPESLQLVSVNTDGTKTYTLFEVKNDVLYVAISDDLHFEPHEWQALTSNATVAALTTLVTADSTVQVDLTLSINSTEHTHSTTIANRQPLQ